MPSTALIVDIDTDGAGQDKPLYDLLTVETDTGDRHAFVHHARNLGADRGSADPVDTATGRTPSMKQKEYADQSYCLAMRET
jgi:hypothetical protein